MENENINISLSEITAESISQQAERWRKAHADASAAAGAYMADLEQRKAELSKLEAGYKSQLKNLNVQRKVLAARVTDLSSRGEIDKAAEEDERLEATDKAISTLERKLRLVNETEPTCMKQPRPRIKPLSLQGTPAWRICAQPRTLWKRRSSV